MKFLEPTPYKFNNSYENILSKLSPIEEDDEDKIVERKKELYNIPTIDINKAINYSEGKEETGAGTLFRPPVFSEDNTPAADIANAYPTYIDKNIAIEKATKDLFKGVEKVTEPVATVLGRGLDILNNPASQLGANLYGISSFVEDSAKETYQSLKNINRLLSVNIPSKIASNFTTSSKYDTSLTEGLDFSKQTTLKEKVDKMEQKRKDGGYLFGIDTDSILGLDVKKMIETGEIVDSAKQSFKTNEKTREEMIASADEETKTRYKELEPYTLAADLGTDILSGYGWAKGINVLTKSDKFKEAPKLVQGITKAADKVLDPSLNNLFKIGVGVGVWNAAHYGATGEDLFSGNTEAQMAKNVALFGAILKPVIAGAKGSYQASKWGYNNGKELLNKTQEFYNDLMGNLDVRKGLETFNAELNKKLNSNFALADEAYDALPDNLKVKYRNELEPQIGKITPGDDETYVFMKGEPSAVEKRVLTKAEKNKAYKTLLELNEQQRLKSPDKFPSQEELDELGMTAKDFRDSVGFEPKKENIETLKKLGLIDESGLFTDNLSLNFKDYRTTFDSLGKGVHPPKITTNTTKALEKNYNNVAVTKKSNIKGDEIIDEANVRTSDTKANVTPKVDLDKNTRIDKSSVKQLIDRNEVIERLEKNPEFNQLDKETQEIVITGEIGRVESELKNRFLSTHYQNFINKIKNKGYIEGEGYTNEIKGIAEYIKDGIGQVFNKDFAYNKIIKQKGLSTDLQPGSVSSTSGYKVNQIVDDINNIIDGIGDKSKARSYEAFIIRRQRLDHYKKLKADLDIIENQLATDKGNTALIKQRNRIKQVIKNTRIDGLNLEDFEKDFNFKYKGYEDVFSEQDKILREKMGELRLFLLNSGIISEDTYKRLVKSYPNYIPSERHIDEFTENYITGDRQLIKSYGDSDKTLKDTSFANIIKYATKVYKNGYRNLELKRIGEEGIFDTYSEKELVKKFGDNPPKHLVTYKDNGKTFYIDTKNERVAKSLLMDNQRVWDASRANSSATRAVLGALGAIAKVPTKMVKTTVTGPLNPLFAISQILIEGGTAFTRALLHKDKFGGATLLQRVGDKIGLDLGGIGKTKITDKVLKELAESENISHGTFFDSMIREIVGEDGLADIDNYADSLIKKYNLNDVASSKGLGWWAKEGYSYYTEKLAKLEELSFRSPVFRGNLRKQGLSENKLKELAESAGFKFDADGNYQKGNIDKLKELLQKEGISSAEAGNLSKDYWNYFARGELVANFNTVIPYLSAMAEGVRQNWKTIGEADKKRLMAMVGAMSTAGVTRYNLETDGKTGDDLDAFKEAIKQGKYGYDIKFKRDDNGRTIKDKFGNKELDGWFVKLPPLIASQVLGSAYVTDKITSTGLVDSKTLANDVLKQTTGVMNTDLSETFNRLTPSILKTYNEYKKDGPYLKGDTGAVYRAIGENYGLNPESLDRLIQSLITTNKPAFDRLLGMVVSDDYDTHLDGELVDKQFFITRWKNAFDTSLSQGFRQLLGDITKIGYVNRAKEYDKETISKIGDASFKKGLYDNTARLEIENTLNAYYKSRTQEDYDKLINIIRQYPEKEQTIKTILKNKNMLEAGIDIKNTKLNGPQFVEVHLMEAIKSNDKKEIYNKLIEGGQKGFLSESEAKQALIYLRNIYGIDMFNQ